MTILFDKKHSKYYDGSERAGEKRITAWEAKQMTPQDKAYEKFCEYLGERLKFRSCMEYENAYGFRIGPSEIIYVLKGSCEVYSSSEIPVDLRPDDRGKEIPLWDHI